MKLVLLMQPIIYFMNEPLVCKYIYDSMYL